MPRGRINEIPVQVQTQANPATGMVVAVSGICAVALLAAFGASFVSNMAGLVSYKMAGTTQLKPVITCAIGQKVGDVNGDGRFDGADATIVNEVYAGSRVSPASSTNGICCYDANLNGNIGGQDAVSILQYSSSSPYYGLTCDNCAIYGCSLNAKPICGKNGVCVPPPTITSSTPVRFSDKVTIKAKMSYYEGGIFYPSQYRYLNISTSSYPGAQLRYIYAPRTSSPVGFFIYAPVLDNSIIMSSSSFKMMAGFDVNDIRIGQNFLVGTDRIKHYMYVNVTTTSSTNEGVFRILSADGNSTIMYGHPINIQSVSYNSYYFANDAIGAFVAGSNPNNLANGTFMICGLKGEGCN